MPFPQTRLRRLRSSAALRSLVRETELSANHLVYPLFALDRDDGREPIPTMPGIERLGRKQLVEEAAVVKQRGIAAVLLFGVTEHKDTAGSGAFSESGVVQEAARAIKTEHRDLAVITDVCLCGYTESGHCGLLNEQGVIDNDMTVEVLGKIALSHCEAGADLVAPSDMTDGRIAGIRSQLDSEGFKDTPIIAYSAKYASAFYGPFREAADTAPKQGDRASYQLDPANGREALREVAEDLAEGADVVMVKPALPYLDVIARLRRRIDAPIAAFNVSGEYAMVKAAAAAGALDERKAIAETLTAIRRAGADLIVSYHAKEAAEWL